MKKSISIFMIMCLLSATACRSPENEPERAVHSSQQWEGFSQPRVAEQDSASANEVLRPGTTGGNDDDEPTKDRQQWRTTP